MVVTFTRAKRLSGAPDGTAGKVSLVVTRSQAASMDWTDSGPVEGDHAVSSARVLENYGM